MVKITNQQGDFKTGSQGEAVYQGRYGQQIRRTRQPKRAIPSQPQIAHRHLYRAALDWRKTLSPDNRRYLEGYCISNWVIDRYKIPLPWHRFALKLALEHIKFIPFLTTKELVEQELVDQEYTIGDDDYRILYETRWIAQTFTPAFTGKLTKVKVKLYRPDEASEFVIKIATTDEQGYPTDNVLCSKDFNSEPITQEEAGLWYQFAFDPLPTLTKGFVYAIIMHGIPPAPDRDLCWRADDTESEYPSGYLFVSNGSGASWTRYYYRDLMFQTFMLVPGEKTYLRNTTRQASSY